MRTLLFFLLLLLPISSFALPIEIQFAIEDITFDFEDLMALAWPLIVLVVSAFWIIKVFKRFIFSS